MKPVYLVGAGPGDPGLITVKGRQILEQADVVLHDHLANEALLGLAPAHAERIYVGKKKAEHARTNNGGSTRLPRVDVHSIERNAAAIAARLKTRFSAVSPAKDHEEPARRRATRGRRIKCNRRLLSGGRKRRG